MEKKYGQTNVDTGDPGTGNMPALPLPYINPQEPIHRKPQRMPPGLSLLTAQCSNAHYLMKQNSDKYNKLRLNCVFKGHVH